MTNRDDASEELLDAAWALIEIRGWRTLSLAEIASEAQIPLSETCRAFPTKIHLLVALVARTDRLVLEQGVADDCETIHDRLFDVLMRRFDALTPHRHAIRSMMSELPTSPSSLLALSTRLTTSMAWMIEAAGLSSAGLSGLLRTQGLAAVYLQGLRVWVDDDSADLARTMAALDKNLRRAASFARRLPFLSTIVSPAEGAARGGVAETEEQVVPSPPVEQHTEPPIH